ncbi:MAG TPA: excinuclease ABC subunit B [Synergistaceae bacterium]|nr:excinuclease ABC subunit B [Synergistaceae bacterium]
MEAALSDTTSGFKLFSEWPPAGDQPEAIDRLVEGFRRGERFQCLLGVTGSGKTFAMANVIERLQRPALVLAHNKTLAAQLYSEFKEFFPGNAVHYFVSYYDYYQPEAYVPVSDVYIEKDASINDRIEKLRLATTKSLLERRDVIVVASVSCIYGLGRRKAYEDAIFRFSLGERYERRDFLSRLVTNHYERNDLDLQPGTFRARGGVVEIFPAYSDTAVRVHMEDDLIERIDEIEPLTGRSILSKPNAAIFPAQHYITSQEAIARALPTIEEELQERLEYFRSRGKLLEAQRLEMRTRYDMEMLTQVGYCSGIENYSRILDGREPGETPGTLLDFFPEDFLFFIDESHITIPQVQGMYNGDRARKQTLVDHGFRLPSCLDNRPLRWEEFCAFLRQACFVSATPGDWETSVSTTVAELIARPTGVVDPEVLVVPATGQIDDLTERLRKVVARGERALVTTLTKRSSEDLAEYLSEIGFGVKYIHSELDAFERTELIRDLRKGEISVLVGVNLLREGIDLPEVSFVGILDADREGFLRSRRSLIQIIGRAARNTAGQVILYADQETGSIRSALDETARRREKQLTFNRVHNITPKTIHKKIMPLLPEEEIADIAAGISVRPGGEGFTSQELERMMWKAVEDLDFERAAVIRDILQGKQGGGSIRAAMDRGKRGKTAQPEKHRRRHT